VNIAGGHHSFDSIPSPRAYALIDHLLAFLQQFKHKAA
jgi:hypothetical protein